MKFLSREMRVLQEMKVYKTKKPEQFVRVFSGGASSTIIILFKSLCFLSKPLLVSVNKGFLSFLHIGFY